MLFFFATQAIAPDSQSAATASYFCDVDHAPALSSTRMLSSCLGDVVANQEITLALAITCAPSAAEQIAFVDCRLTDRDGALFHEPMRVQWHVPADAALNQWQPVSQSVLIAIGNIGAEREPCSPPTAVAISPEHVAC